MRKFLLLLAVCCSLTMMSKGQGARFGFDAGILSSMAKVTSDNQTSSSKSRIGFNVGVLVDVKMGNDFSFQPGLNFVQKGGKDDEGSTSADISLNFLELPLDFIYHAKGKTGSFFIGAGPSLSYGLSGKAKVTSGGVTITESLHLGSSENDDLKRLEFGGNVLTGYEWKSGVFISFNYNAGFSNMSPQTGTKWKNNYVGLHIGFVLPDKRH
jgi:hypothetical protein